MKGFYLITVTLAEANAFVKAHHRRHKPVQGHKFSLGAMKAGSMVGVAIVGRPVARLRQDGRTLEVTRLCTDGTRNACSFLYGAAARATFALGYKRLGTYSLPAEGGASMRGAGWRLVAQTKAQDWDRPSRPRKPTVEPAQRWLWEAVAP